MSVTDQQYDEVYDVLKRHLKGLSFEDLWRKCKGFDEKTDLSICLHRAGQQGNVHKESALYKLTASKYQDMTGQVLPEEEQNSMVDEIRSLMQKVPEVAKKIEEVQKEEQVVKPKPEPKVHRVQPRTITKEPQHLVKPKPEELPPGDLRRSKVLGGVAFACYRFRDEENGLSYEDLMEMLGISKIMAYQVTGKLIERNYLIRTPDSTLRNAKFKWSNKFRYPFENWQKEDETMVRFTVAEWVKHKGTSKVFLVPPDQYPAQETPTAAPSQVSGSADVSCCNGFSLRHVENLKASGDNQGAIAMIDFQINTYKTQIAQLESIRSLLQPA